MTHDDAVRHLREWLRSCEEVNGKPLADDDHLTCAYCFGEKGAITAGDVRAILARVDTEARIACEMPVVPERCTCPAIGPVGRDNLCPIHGFKVLGAARVDRCGAMRVATREICELQNDHWGEHRFASEWVEADRVRALVEKWQHEARQYLSEDYGLVLASCAAELDAALKGDR